MYGLLLYIRIICTSKIDLFSEPQCNELIKIEGCVSYYMRGLWENTKKCILDVYTLFVSLNILFLIYLTQNMNLYQNNVIMLPLTYQNTDARNSVGILQFFKKFRLFAC